MYSPYLGPQAVRVDQRERRQRVVEQPSGGAHVDRIGDAEVFVKAVSRRQVLGPLAEVPLAQAEARVPHAPERRGKGRLVPRQSSYRRWAENAASPCGASEARANRKTAGQHGRARRRTHMEGRVPLREADTAPTYTRVANFFFFPRPCFSPFYRRLRSCACVSTSTGKLARACPRLCRACLG